MIWSPRDVVLGQCRAPVTSGGVSAVAAPASACVGSAVAASDAHLDSIFASAPSCSDGARFRRRLVARLHVAGNRRSRRRPSCPTLRAPSPPDRRARRKHRTPVALDSASGFTASSGFCCSGVTSCDRKLTFALISGRMRGSIVSNLPWSYRRLRAIDRRNHPADVPAKTRVGQRIEDDLRRLADAGPWRDSTRTHPPRLRACSCRPSSPRRPSNRSAFENGVTRSPTFALFDRITPSKGARICV